jgi:hypothetical protein
MTLFRSLIASLNDRAIVGCRRCMKLSYATKTLNFVSAFTKFSGLMINPHYRDAESTDCSDLNTFSLLHIFNAI